MALVTGRRPYAAAVAVLMLALLPRPSLADPAEELRKEVEAMKAQLREMRQQMKKQQELIEKLSVERGTAPAAPPHVAAPVKPAPTTVAEDEQSKRITENVMRRIQPSLAAANKTFASQFNPAIGFIIDTVGSYSRKDRGNFEFRSGEVGISAAVDPFVRGYAILNGTDHGVDVEEAAIVTTSLPYNLQVKGGRFFADFGRLSKFHDHDLPFVNRPIVLDQYIGGESQADGVELSWLAPMKQYLTLTAGAYNKVGADNDRVSNSVARDLSEFTYLGRAATYLNLSDANGVDLGLSYAYTPEVRIENAGQRHLAGVDLTYRYLPLSQTQYHGLIWGTELLYNQEDRPVGGTPATAAGIVPSVDQILHLSATDTATTAAATAQGFKRRDAVGLYSYLEGRFSKNIFAGLLGEYVEDIDGVGETTEALSPYLSIWPSEFQRIRLQYSRVEHPAHEGGSDDRYFLQWTVILGSHVHGFRDR